MSVRQREKEIEREMPVNTATRHDLRWMASKAPESPRLPYGVSFFSILIVFSGVGNASVGSGVVSSTTALQSGPPQPMSQKHRLALVQNCAKREYPEKKERKKGGDLYAQKQAHQLCMFVCMHACEYTYIYTHTHRVFCSSWRCCFAPLRKLTPCSEHSWPCLFVGHLVWSTCGKRLTHVWLRQIKLSPHGVPSLTRPCSG